LQPSVRASKTRGSAEEEGDAEVAEGAEGRREEEEGFRREGDGS